MKKYSFVIWSYAVLLIIGGTIGFIKAGSLMSILAATGFSFILSLCAYGIWKSNRMAYQAAVLVLAFLLAFFGYRFSLSYQMMPAGLMILITTVVLIPLLMKYKTAYQAN